MLSGLAHSMPQLILFRGLQGLGAGGVLPVTLTIIGDLYNLEERARVQVLFTSMWGTASLAGPAVGAFLTKHLSWRFVFYVNLPFVLISGALVGLYLRESGKTARSVHIDYAGSALLTGCVVSLLLLFQSSAGATGRPYVMLTLAALAVALLVAFLRQERRVVDPMLPLSLLSRPVIASAMVGNLLIGVMMYAMDSYMPLFMQGVRGGDPDSASLVLTPLILCWSLSAYFGAKALVRFGFARVAVFGSVCIFTSAVLLMLTQATTPTPIIILTMAILGSGLGPASMSFLVSAQNAVPWRQRGVVTAASQFFRSMGGTVGVGAFGAALNARMGALLQSTHTAHLEPNALLDTHERAMIPPKVLHHAQFALYQGLHLVFLMLAAAALLGLTGVILLSRRQDPALRSPEESEPMYDEEIRSDVIPCAALE